VGEALALGAALCFGITDFVSALLARQVHSAAVALVAQLGGTALILVAALLVPARRWRPGRSPGAPCPVVPVLLGLTVLRERLTRIQDRGSRVGRGRRGPHRAGRLIRASATAPISVASAAAATQASRALPAPADSRSPATTIPATPKPTPPAA
jgi:hypothetical protein